MAIEIRDRDIEVLRTLFASRVMTIQQAALLHFNGSNDAATKRIQKLKAAGVIGERERGRRDRSILFLTKQGFKELTDGAHIDDFPRLTWEQLKKRVQVSDRTLAHELDVMDVKAAITAAVAKTDRFKISEFSTWPKLYEFEAMAPPEDRLANPRMIVRPDGFIRIEESDEEGPESDHTFFLEVDRSNESQSVLARKACCYRDYYRRGGFAERCGLSRHEYEKAPFVALMVFKTEARRDNTAETLLKLRQPILTQVWMTTMKEIATNPLGVIWVKPKDYRKGGLESGFDLRDASNPPYGRTEGPPRIVAPAFTLMHGVFES